MLRIGIITCIACFLVGCAGTAVVTEATSQAWYGGAAGAGGGKRYVVHLRKPAGLALTVDQVWLGDREKGWLADFRVVYKDLPNGQRNHEGPKGVTDLSILFEEITPGAPPPRGDVRPSLVRPFDRPPGDLPANFDKGAVLYAHSRGKSATWVVNEMTVLEPIYYP